VLDVQLLAFVGVAIVVVVLPGPDMALVLRNGLRGGSRAAYRTILGIVAGLLVWAIASAAGVGAVLAASTTLFTVLKLAGGVYLVVLGLQTLLALRRADRTIEVRTGRGTGSPFREGLLSNLFNPKIAVLFTTLLPQFISADDPAFAKSLLLSAIFVAIGMLWLSVYAQVISVLAGSLRVRRALQAVTGVVLTALGVRLAFDRS